MLYEFANGTYNKRNVKVYAVNTHGMCWEADEKHDVSPHTHTHTPPKTCSFNNPVIQVTKTSLTVGVRMSATKLRRRLNNCGLCQSAGNLNGPD